MKFPQQNINQSATGIGGQNFSGTLCTKQTEVLSASNLGLNVKFIEY